MLSTGMSAVCACSFGLIPLPLIVIPNPSIGATGSIATITDFSIPNLSSFGMCSSPLNPIVATATILAGGVLTPMPCLPAISAPWVTGSLKMIIGAMPASSQTDKTFCTFGGVISITFPGQTTMID